LARRRALRFTCGHASRRPPANTRTKAIELLNVGAKVRAGVDATARLGDADTADLFTGISPDNDKYLWFLEAHLHAKR
jgi:hypothetical protein